MHLSVAGREFLGLQLSVPRAVASEQSSAFACSYYRDINHTHGPSSPLRRTARVIETRHFNPKSKLQQGIGVKLLSSAWSAFLKVRRLSPGEKLACQTSPFKLAIPLSFARRA